MTAGMSQLQIILFSLLVILSICIGRLMTVPVHTFITSTFTSESVTSSQSKGYEESSSSAMETREVAPTDLSSIRFQDESTFLSINSTPSSTNMVSPSFQQSITSASASSATDDLTSTADKAIIATVSSFSTSIAPNQSSSSDHLHLENRTLLPLLHSSSLNSTIWKGNNTVHVVLLPNDGSVLYFILGCFGVYLVFLFILRRKDEKYADRIGGVILPPYHSVESKETDWYEVQFNTGEERCAGTTAAVFAKVICAAGVSQIFRLSDPLCPTRKLFKTGSVTTFLFPLPRYIGDPEGLLLWHDNTGNDPCWLLRSVSVRDVASDWSKLFIFNNWLSMLQPGCRTLVFLSNELIEGKKITQSHTWVILRHCIMNSHSWLSLLFSSPLCRLRRTQRLSCLLLFIVILIFTLAISYKDTKIVDDRKPTGLVCFDKVCLILSDVVVILRACIIAWIVSTIILFTFQYTEQEENYLYRALRNALTGNKNKTEDQTSIPDLQVKRERAESFDSGCIMTPEVSRRSKQSGADDLDVIMLQPSDDLKTKPHSLLVTSNTRQSRKDSNVTLSSNCSSNSPSSNHRKLRKNSVSPTSGVSDLLASRKSISGVSMMSFGSRRNTTVTNDTIINMFSSDPNPPDLKRYASVNVSLQPRKSIFHELPIYGLRKRSYYAMSIPKTLVKENESKYLIPASLIYVIWVVILAASIVFSYMTYRIADSWSNQTTKIWLICTVFAVTLDILFFQFILPLWDFSRIIFTNKAQSASAMVLHSTRNVWSNIETQWMKVFHDQTITEFYKDYGEFAPKIPKDIEKTREKMKSKREVNTLLYSFPYYFLLIAVLLAVCYGNRDPSAYQIRNHMEEIFVKSMPFEGVPLTEVNDIPSLWKWWDTTVMPGLFNKSEYMLRLPKENSLTVSLSDRESMMIGVPRVRQLRVQKDSCNIAPDFKTVIFECNDFYEWSNEETGKYFVGWETKANNLSLPAFTVHSPWQYQTGSQVNNSISVWGEMAVYKGGGYLAELSRGYSKAKDLNSHLEENQWIDKYTRAIITELTVYNPNVNLAAYLIVTVDVIPTGLALRRHDMGIVRLYRFLYIYQWAFLICELITLLFVLYTLYTEIGNIFRKRLQYFKSIWTLNKLIFVLSGLAMVGFYVLREKYLSDGLKQFNVDHHRYISFYQIAVFDELIVYMLAVMELSAVLQFVHFLSFQKGVTIILKTLGSAAVELGGFYSYIGVWIMAFSSYSYLKFVSEVEDFSKMTSTMRSLLSLLLGGLRYESYQNNSPYMLALMFVFIVIMYLVVANVFISIIQRSHSRVSGHYKGVKERYGMADVGIALFDRLFGAKVAGYFKKKLKGKKRPPRKLNTKVHFDTSAKVSRSNVIGSKHTELQKQVLRELEQAKELREKKGIKKLFGKTQDKRPPGNRGSKRRKSDGSQSGSQALTFLSKVQAPRLNEAVNTVYCDFYAEDFVFMENMLRLVTNQTTDINVYNIKREFLKVKALRATVNLNSMVNRGRFRGVSRSILMIQTTYKKVQRNQEDSNSLHSIMEQSCEETVLDMETENTGMDLKEEKIDLPPSGHSTMFDKKSNSKTSNEKFQIPSLTHKDSYFRSPQGKEKTDSNLWTL